MKKLFILMFILFAFFLFISADNMIDCVIRFSNEQIYFLGKPIIVKIEVLNKSQSDYFIEIADDIAYNVDFQIFSEDGEMVDFSDAYILRKQTKEKIFTKNILLSPGESFSSEIDISQWYKFEKSGQYMIQAVFVPFLDSDSRILSKNILKLNLKPQVPEQSQEMKSIEYKESIVSNLKDVPPYKIVELHLKARQRKDWDEFFAYFDYDKIIMNYQTFMDKYKYASETQRLAIIEDFKKFLLSTFYSDLIYFEIQKTVIEKEKAVVDVYLEFRYKNFIEKFSGQYYLTLKNQIWLISGYEVTPLK